MDKLQRSPDSASYSVKNGTEVIAVQLDGGSARYRRDVVGATAQVEVQWTCDRDDYRYLRAFFNTATARGSLPFLIDLVIDDADLTEHTAYFIPGSFGLSSQKGHTYVVSASLEAKPNAPDAYTDGLTMLFYGSGLSDDEMLDLFGELEELVNESLEIYHD